MKSIILKQNNGFTLIEALIAIMVLSVGIMAVNIMQISSIKGNTTSNKITVASTSNISGFEKFLNVDYDDPALDPAGNPHTQAELAGFVLPSGVTSITWNVTEWTDSDVLDNDGDGKTDETDERDIKSIVLIVNYTNRTAKTLTCTFLKTEVL